MYCTRVLYVLVHVDCFLIKRYICWLPVKYGVVTSYVPGKSAFRIRTVDDQQSTVTTSSYLRGKRTRLMTLE
jgi:hypothetical protein